MPLPDLQTRQANFHHVSSATCHAQQRMQKHAGGLSRLRDAPPAEERRDGVPGAAMPGGSREEPGELPTEQANGTCVASRRKAAG